MTLLVFVAGAAIVLFAVACADPGEYAADPLLSHAQNVLGVLFAIFLVLGGLWLTVR